MSITNSPPDRVNRPEIAAWISVVTGAAQMILAMVAAIPVLGALERSVPAGQAALQTPQALIVLFAGLVLVAMGACFAAIGLGVLLGHLFRTIAAPAPFHAAFCVSAATLLAAGAATLGITNNVLWLWFALQAVLAVVLAGVAQADEEKVTFNSLAIIGTAGTVLLTLFFASVAGPPSIIRPPVNAPALAQTERDLSGGATATQ